jgi:hypothetical protein
MRRIDDGIELHDRRGQPVMRAVRRRTCARRLLGREKTSTNLIASPALTASEIFLWRS